MKDDTIPGGKAAIDLYFIQDDGGMFKTTIPFEPYFFVGCKVSPSSSSPRAASLPVRRDRPSSFPCLSTCCTRCVCVHQLGTETVVEEWLMKKYEGLVTRVVRVKKEDLKLVSSRSPPSFLLVVRPRSCLCFSF